MEKINSDVKLLQFNFMTNLHTVIILMKEEGWIVQVVETLRTQARQTELNLAGKAPATVSFHAVGLAVDVCEAVHGYLHHAFFEAFGRISKSIGFTWGGDWKSYDGGHIQWDDNGRYTGAQVIKGAMPPPMPLMALMKLDNTPDAYALTSVNKAINMKLLQGNDSGDMMLHSEVTRQDLCVILDRLELLK